MPATIRKANAADAPRWLALLRATLGDAHPAPHVYDEEWIKTHLEPAAVPGGGEKDPERLYRATRQWRADDAETWVAEADGELAATLSVLNPPSPTETPVANLGRNLFRESSFANGAADALLQSVLDLCEQRKQMVVARVLASDNAQQVLFETHGCVCVGFQPLKHVHKAREEILFYARPARARLSQRAPLSESLPQIVDLAGAALANLNISGAPSARDGATGYPLKTEVAFAPATSAEFEAELHGAKSSNPPVEISGSFNWGFGLMRIATSPDPLKATIARRAGMVVGGLRHYLDDIDSCVRLVDGFSTDDLTMGALLAHVVDAAHREPGVAYVEADILTTAPRLLKSAEQLGFVPVAYLPAFHVRDDAHTDVVKMVKLNVVCTVQQNPVTSHAHQIVRVIEGSLADHRLGVALINLLRGLTFFDGLGDGELRKVARLFVQKLYRPGERVFGRGDSCDEAFVVMRGSVSIALEDNTEPIGAVSQGELFGEQAFLDGAARVATATATQPTILLTIQRAAFQKLAQREPHLGMAVMRNFALGLSRKLRRMNVISTGTK